MDRRLWRHFDYWLLLGVIVLLLGGVAMIYSASRGDPLIERTPTDQAVTAMAGLVALLIFGIFDYTLLKNVSWILYATDRAIADRSPDFRLRTLRRPALVRAGLHRHPARRACQADAGHRPGQVRGRPARQTAVPGDGRSVVPAGPALPGAHPAAAQPEHRRDDLFHVAGGHLRRGARAPARRDHHRRGTGHGVRGAPARSDPGLPDQPVPATPGHQRRSRRDVSG